MNRPPRRAVLAGGVLAAAGLAGRGAAAQESDAAFRALLDRLALTPDEDPTPEGAARRRRAASLRLAEFAAFDPTRLSPDASPVHASVLHGLRTEAALHQLFPFGAVGGGATPYAVHPRAGSYARAAAAARGTVEQRARLVRELDGETERVAQEGALGVVLPRRLLDRTLTQIAEARTRAAAAPDVEAALDRQARRLETLRPAAPTAPGVWRLKDGDAYYALALSLACGGSVSPEAAHRDAVRAVRALHARADPLLRGQGLTQGSVAERLRELGRDPRWAYPPDAAGKSRAVADMNRSLEAIRARMRPAFGDLSLPGAEVRRLTDEEEAAGRQGYRAAPAGGGPGIYYVDLSRVARRPNWSLPSVVHHELLPGHLLEATLSSRAAPHPLQLRYASGYSEGWAIYAEGLADELGAFESDPRGELGYLQWMLFRLGRLVVETGLHAGRWSRERAIAELRRIQGEDIAFISIEEDVDRLCMQPGAAAGHAVCARALMQLREEARRTLGPRFDLAGFHAAVTDRGPLGVSGVRAAVESWTRRRRA